MIIAFTDETLVRRVDRLEKIVTDRDLFGATIRNPYPDKEDDESLRKYREVRDQLDHLIDEKFDAILERAKAKPQFSLGHR